MNNDSFKNKLNLKKNNSTNELENIILKEEKIILIKKKNIIKFQF